MGRRTVKIARGVSLDVDRLVSSRALLTASSGAGKSQTLRWLLEQTSGMVQQIIVDREGEFRTLRELPGSDYLIASAPGEDAEVIAHPKTAKVLARKILEVEISTVLDLSDLRPHERFAFVGTFLNALIESPKKFWKVPRLVVIDEAHRFAPEKGKAESASAVVDLMAMGRKRNMGGILATQRLSKLSADARGEAGSIFIGRTYQDVDLRRVADLLGKTKSDWPLIRSLEDGEFFAFGPALTKGVHRFKFPRCQTTHPEAGAGAIPTPAPSSKVARALAGLGDLLTESETEARTEQELRKALATARREITLLKKGAPVVSPKVERVEVPVEIQVPVLSVADRRALESLRDRSQRHADGLATVATDADELIADLVARTQAAPKKPIRSRHGGARPVPSPPRAPRRESLSAETNGSLSGPEQRILNALAWLESIGIEEAPDPPVAFLAGYRSNGGAYNNPRGRLRSRGLIEYRGNLRALTEEGREMAEAPASPLTTEQLHSHVFAKLPTPEQRILQPLLDSYPEPMTNEDLADAAGYSGGGGAYNNPRGRLRSLGLVDYPQPGYVVARDLLFIE